MDIFGQLPLGITKDSAFNLKIYYEAPELRKKPFTLTSSFSITRIDANATVGHLMDLVTNQFIKLLAQLQTGDIRRQALNLTLLDKQNGPSESTFRRRLAGLYGTHPKLSTGLNLDFGFRFDIRSLPVKSDSVNAPKAAPAAIYSLRGLTLRGVPPEYVDFDRDPSSDAAMHVKAITKLFLEHLISDEMPLRFKMVVQRPTLPIRLQLIAAVDPLGLKVSPLTGPKAP